MVRWCWVNFQCRGVLLIWIRAGQGPTTLVAGGGGGCLDIFSLVYHFSFLSPSLWETARYRLKYCLKGPLNRKQPTNQPTATSKISLLFLGLCPRNTGTFPSGLDGFRFYRGQELSLDREWVVGWCDGAG